MKNRGQITVYLCLVINVMLLLGLTSLEGIRIYMGRGKVERSAIGAANSIMADYNSELFRRYHLLLIDTAYGGRGEAYMEERMEEYLDYNLNSSANIFNNTSSYYEFDINDVALVAKVGILDDNMSVFKYQIDEYIKTYGIKDITEMIIEKTKDTKESKISKEENGGINVEPLIDNFIDPREMVALKLSSSMLDEVLPAGEEVSKEEVDLSKTPSKVYKDYDEENSIISPDFQHLEEVEKIMDRDKVINQLSNKGADEIKAYLYALNCFSSMTNPAEEETVFDYELEYILCGKSSDYKNLEEVAKKLLMIRYPIQFKDIQTNETKKSSALVLATAISAVTTTEVAIETYQKIILAAWAFLDAIADVKKLMAGDKIDNLSYEEYLLILMSLELNQDKKYYRMLDIMQLNMQISEKDFYIKNCATAIQISGDIGFNPLFKLSSNEDNYHYYFEEERSY